ncbi:Carboxypeptidase A4 [Holothuria leucospilota]|uniref:Carboxypeptidase A4 n=1 Tax=Holothuria leucospilota TaxID=206669 RepID=A0A9Q1C356_HOLLE|nr:Carboxypeptidase A4 [Holothuria leucospilota]
MKLVLLLAAFQLVHFSTNAEELYRGNQLLRILVEEEEVSRWMHSLQKRSSRSLDFWTSSMPGRKLDVMVARGYLDEFKTILNERKLQFEVIMEDVQEYVDREKSQTEAAQESKSEFGALSLQDFDYSIYHTYDEIQQWTVDIASEYSSFVKLFTFGYTFEGREIRALEISAPPVAEASDPKPIVYFEGGIHSREWISPATIMFFTSQFLKNYVAGTDDAERTLGMYDFHIVPLLNCDGYVYTWTVERLWRKSRQLNPDFGCVGADLNRNFDAFWGETWFTDYQDDTHVNIDGGKI